MKALRRNIALFMLAVFATWQFGALVHFATVPHALCSHGQVVDAHRHGHDHGGGNHHACDHRHPGDGENQDDEGHDDCRTVALITQARSDVTPGASTVAVEIPEVVFSAPVAAEAQIHPTDDLYLTAPSHSPPAA